MPALANSESNLAIADHSLVKEGSSLISLGSSRIPVEHEIRWLQTSLNAESALQKI